MFPGLFRVGGTIDMGGEPIGSWRILAGHPYITIAGQTAPGDGIALKHGELLAWGTHNVIVRHLRIRGGVICPTCSGNSWGGFEVGQAHDVIWDHCSVAWGEDDQIGVTGTASPDIPPGLPAPYGEPDGSGPAQWRASQGGVWVRAAGPGATSRDSGAAAMIPSGVRIFVCTETVDMRRSFDALALAVQEELRLDPQSGALFVFGSKRGMRLKVLWFDGNGYCILYKRLDRL